MPLLPNAGKAAISPCKSPGAAWRRASLARAAPQPDRSVPRSLEEFAAMGTPHDRVCARLRSTGIPGLSTATVLFLVTDRTVLLLRIGYLGRDVWRDFLQSQ